MDLDKYSDISIITATLVQECGGEPYAGQMLVAQTMKNRSIQRGKSIREVCLEPKQYSCWNNKGEMWLRFQTIRKHPAWESCRQLAEEISAPRYEPVSEATNYYAFKKIKPPNWVKRMVFCAEAGGHRFYRARTT